MAKNVQISARFPTTFDFDPEYLQNGSTYRTSEKNVIDCNPFHVDKRHFAGDYISALRGCCSLKFLHALEIDQGLLAHTPTGKGCPPPRKKKLQKN